MMFHGFGLRLGKVHGHHGCSGKAPEVSIPRGSIAICMALPITDISTVGSDRQGINRWRPHAKESGFGSGSSSAVCQGMLSDIFRRVRDLLI